MPYISDDKHGSGFDAADSESTNNSTSDTDEQGGFGKRKRYKRKQHNEDNEEFINKIADKVAQKIASNPSTSQSIPIQNSVSQIKEPLIEPSNNEAILPFDNVILKNDEADDFNEKRLLSLIPNGNKKKAKRLLKIIDENGHLITFNSNGILFLNGISIPNSNIFEIFPQLFKQSKPKYIPGLLDIIEQLKTMNLLHLIVMKDLKLKQPKLNEQTFISDNFWYLG